MAAPYISGAMAVVKQYVEQKHLADSETAKAELVSDLLMSTADLVMAGTAPYSPRKQGAGSVNIAAATAAKAYLTAEDGTPAQGGAGRRRPEVRQLHREIPAPQPV